MTRTAFIIYYLQNVAYRFINVFPPYLKRLSCHS